MHQLGGVVLGERRLHLPGPQQCFGYGPQLLNVIAALDGSLLHRECELPAEGRLFHGLAQRLNNTLQTPASRLRGGLVCRGQCKKDAHRKNSKVLLD
jgi:hypothetical protein